MQVYGIPESQLAIKLTDWENALPDFLHLAYLPNFGIVKLRLSGVAEDALKLDFAMNQQIELLTHILGDSIFSFEDKPIEVILSDKLKEKGLTISTAESCTGGNIAHRLTLIAGSSDYFKGSVVAYHNDVKKNVLRVSADDLESNGAVSQHVVEQMASGVQKITQTDLAVAVSGIAGPTGESEEKPIGTVWISVYFRSGIVSRIFQFGNYNRENIIERSTLAALMMVNELI